MRKRCYLAALMRQSPDWVRASMAEPTSYMTRTHVLLHAVALQRMRALTPNAEVSGAGTASAGLPGYAEAGDKDK